MAGMRPQPPAIAFGLVSGDVTANSGNAVVLTWSDVTNTITAGQDAIVIAGGGDNVTVTAGNDAAVLAMGSSTVFVYPGRDGYVWTAGGSGGPEKGAQKRG